MRFDQLAGPPVLRQASQSTGKNAVSIPIAFAQQLFRLSVLVRKIVRVHKFVYSNPPLENAPAIAGRRLAYEQPPKL